MAKVHYCVSCHTVNGDFHNGCQCDICDGYIIQKDVPKDEMTDFITKYKKKYEKWAKIHVIYVKEDKNEKEKEI